MRSRSSPLRWLVLLLLGIFVCLGAASAGLLLGLVPDVIDRLGPPDPGLSAPERTVLSAYLVLRQGQLDQALNPALGSVQIEVAEGWTAVDVASALAEANLVQDPSLLTSYLRYRGLDRGIEAGGYALSGSMTIPELAQALQRAAPDEALFTIPEGWRLEQVADRIDASGLAFDGAAFVQAAHSRPAGFPFLEELPPEASLEGYLFPDSYRLDEASSADDLVRLMLENFDGRVPPAMRNQFEQRGLTTFEAVTVASIVEREAVIATEQATVASVFLNRLALGMRLEADPTVQYALGLQPDGSWWKLQLTASDLSLASPYNTYVAEGVPPGPIASPGVGALQAIAEPEETLYLYFRAACDGSGAHLFATTFEQHLANACQ